MSARAGIDGKRDWTFERVMATFPRLTERLSHGGQQLSGGEQQMLSIGRALMTNPRLMILDEATEGLAPLIVAEIWRVIADIRATGIATLIVDRDYRKVLGAHRPRGGDGEGPHRAARRVGRAGGRAGRAGGTARRVIDRARAAIAKPRTECQNSALPRRNAMPSHRSPLPRRRIYAASACILASTGLLVADGVNAGRVR